MQLSKKAMAPHSSTLAWKSPWMEEPGGLQSMGSLTTERLHFHFSLSCIGEGNGNPLQGSCPENPRDGGAWWAAIYGVSQSQTQLKLLSSSSSNETLLNSFIIANNVWVGALVFSVWSIKLDMATHSDILAWRSPMNRRSGRATVHRVAKISYYLFSSNLDTIYLFSLHYYCS